jgi:hypothetical protein
MLPDNHTLVTIVWTSLHVLPLVVVALIWFLFGAVWGIVSLVLYVIGIVLYGFFVSLPVMVRLFRKPASLHRR